MLLLRLTFAFLLVMPLSASFLNFVPFLVLILASVMIILVTPGSCSCWVIVRFLHELGQVSNLYEFLNFLFEELTIFGSVTIIVMVSIVFGFV